MGWDLFSGDAQALKILYFCQLLIHGAVTFCFSAELAKKWHSYVVKVSVGACLGV